MSRGSGHGSRGRADREAVAAPVRRGYVDTGAGQIHYRACPAPGRPRLLFLHQTASSSAMYEKLMRTLAGEYDMAALDTPGFGGSFDPDGKPSTTHYCQWLLEAAEQLGFSRCHLFGHHTGACFGVEIAARNPERVESLTMIGPVPLSGDEREQFRVHFSTPMAPAADGAHLRATWDYLAALGADRDLGLHHRELLDTVRAWRGRYQAYSAVWDQDWSGFFRQVSCPILIMCAPDDVLAPYFERAQQMRADAIAVALQGANFEPDLDAGGIAAALRGFLQRLR